MWRGANEIRIVNMITQEGVDSCRSINSRAFDLNKIPGKPVAPCDALASVKSNIQIPNNNDSMM